LAVETVRDEEGNPRWILVITDLRLVMQSSYSAGHMIMSH
jgi:hypothetical protein